MDMRTITNRLNSYFTFRKTCFFCRESPAHTFEIINSLYLICLPCQVRYVFATRQLWLDCEEEDIGKNFFPVECLYSYQGAVKEMLYEAKIGSSFHHIRAWQELICQRVERLLEDGQKFYAVMPCPSSLWSRLRGRSDLAWFLSQRIQERFQIPLLSPPFHLHWRYQKQAKRKGRHSRYLQVNKQALVHDKTIASLLLVDDILTSGGTMVRLRRALANDHENCYGLVLAKA